MTTITRCSNDPILYNAENREPTGMTGTWKSVTATLLFAVAIAGCTPALKENPLIIRTANPYTAEPDILHFAEAVISPKGRYVAFAYSTIHGGKKRIAEIDTRTSNLTVYELSEECEFTDPAYLPDGTGLVAIKYCAKEEADHRYGARDQVVRIDRETQVITPLTDKMNFRSSPANSPDGQYLFYVESIGRRFQWRDHKYWGEGIGWLKKSNLITGKTQTFFTQEQGGSFMSLGVSSFLENDGSRLLLDARSPRRGNPLRTDFTVSKGPANALTIELDKDGQAKLIPENWLTDNLNAVASPNRSGVFFSDRSRAKQFNDHKNSWGNKEWFNYELFTVRDGKLVELTKLQSMVYGISMSLDGRKIAYVGDESRQNTDAWIYDIESGVARQTGIRELLRRYHFEDD
jgi:hypothetical protein